MPSETHASETLQSEFESTVLPHLEGVFRLAMWLGRDRSEAEDVVQETFTQALQSFHRFQPGTNARAWVLTIMRHVRANRNRARRRSPLEVDGEQQLERIPAVPQTPQHVTAGEILAALAVLPAGYQEVVLLCDVEDLTYREIAGVMGLPIGTVMSRLHRARRLLRVALTEYASAQGIGRTAGGARRHPRSEVNGESR